MADLAPLLLLFGVALAAGFEERIDRWWGPIADRLLTCRRHDRWEG